MGIESQLDRVRHERELWKEVVDKRAQQPLQLALTLKDPHTGQPLASGGGMPMQAYSALPGMAGTAPGVGGHTSFSPRPLLDMPPDSARMMQPQPGLGPGPAPGMVAAADQPGGAMKASPLAKRIAKPPAPPPQRA